MKYGFSLELVDTHNQQPNRNRMDCKYYWDEMYTYLAAGGFKAVEYPYDIKWAFGGRSGVPLVKRSIMIKDGSPANYLERLRAAGLEEVPGIHIDPTFLFSGNVDAYFFPAHHFSLEAIDYVAELGGKYISFTATPSIGDLKLCFGADFEAKSKELLERLKKEYAELANYAEEKGVTLCLKNEFWSLLRGNAIVDFVKSIDANVKIDIDTANLKIAGACPKCIIKENPELIGVVHFTDTAFKDEEEAYAQQMPEFPKVKATKVFRDIGQGEVDFPGIEKVLKEVGYDGYVIFNCRNSIDPCRAILRTRYYADKYLGK